jgi:hypothetical protein
MEAFSIIALLLLLFFGYSFGSVIGVGRSKTATPEPLDIGVVLVLVFLAFLSRPHLSKWLTLGLWVFSTVLVSMILSYKRKAKDPQVKQEATVMDQVSGWQRLWTRWKALAIRLGDYQGRLILALFYFGVITIWGLLVRLLGDPLKLRKSQVSSFWVNRLEVSTDIKEAERQY